MSGWPRIDEPELRRRLAFTDEEFLAYTREWVASVPRREFSERLYRQALAYPFARPASSYLLRGTNATPINALAPRERERALGLIGGGRHPLLAFGANGSPERLALKFSELPAEDRELLVVVGDLHDFDVGAAPLPAFYGALPATLFPSPGAVVRASLLWASDAQLTMLTWSEVSYFLGRLEGVRFIPDAPDMEPVGGLYGFVSRWGAVCIDDEPVAMAAIPATTRKASALTQEGLLDHAAAALDDDTRARDLVAAILEDFAGAAMKVAERLGPTARLFESTRWTRYVGVDRPNVRPMG